jgi:uncharacterized membrane protein
MKTFLIFANSLYQEQRIIIFLAVQVIIHLIFWNRYDWHLTFMFSWIIACIIFLALLLPPMFVNQGEDIKQKYGAREPNTLLFLITLVILIFVSLVSCGILLSSISNVKLLSTKIWWISLSIFSILISWLLLNINFCLQYGRVYYDQTDNNGISFPKGFRGGLIFPETDYPSSLDFLYLSFTIALTYAVSDVNVTRTIMRMYIVFQSVLSFLFYSTVVTIFFNTIVQLLGDTST